MVRNSVVAMELLFPRNAPGPLWGLHFYSEVVDPQRVVVVRQASILDAVNRTRKTVQRAV